MSERDFSADNYDRRLDAADFATLLGIEPDAVTERTREKLSSVDLAYRFLSYEERDQVLLDVFKRIDSGEFEVAGPKRQSRWEEGWGENLRLLRESGDPAALMPKYYRPHSALRLGGRYASVRSPTFETDWYAAFRVWLFETFLKPFDTVYEFGCGSAHNIVELARMFPEKAVVGCDWAESACTIVEELRHRFGYRTTGHRFNLFEPDTALPIAPNSAVMTIGALEQVGANHGPFLDYLTERRPALCIHVEPLVDFYDAGNIVDYAAIRFHRQRNYLSGFVPAIEAMAATGKAEIVFRSRCNVGSLFHENSVLIWRLV